MTNTDNPTEQERAEQVATNLERLAAFVRDNPDLAEDFAYQRFLVCLSQAEDPRTALADIARRARRAGATMTKNASDKYAGALLSFGGLTIDAYAPREQVCERIVTGTREVEVEEPDPDAVAALPKVKRVEVVEDVRWECTPLLAPAEQDDAEAVAAR